MASEEFPGAEEFFPDEINLTALREAAGDCRGCPLHQRGTQTVFGEGLVRSLMMVGEQPGDEEDKQGRPFVGPAGRVLDQALEEAGIARDDAYVTNVVKHFKWVPKGKRRLHNKPNAREIRACIPWLEAEIEVVKPRVIVALGATAAQAIISPDFRVTRQRGEFVESDLAEYVTATVHPSSILRQETDRDRERAMRALVEDFKKIEKVLNGDGRRR